METFLNLLYHFTWISVISANVFTLKDLKLKQDFQQLQHNCDFHGKLMRVIVGLSNPSTSVASGYGDLF